MMYIEFAAGGNNYKLRLTTRNIVTLEKDLGFNPIFVFSKNKENAYNPTTEQMVVILHNALKHYHPELTRDNAYEIFDAYLDDGHIVNEFTGVVYEVYVMSGLLKADTESEKN